MAGEWVFDNVVFNYFIFFMKRFDISNLNFGNKIPTIVLRPHYKQFFIDQLVFIVLAVAFIVGGFFIGEYGWIAYLAAGVVVVYLSYQILYLARMEYIITAEQLLFVHGVAVQSTDYMELYRIVDYQQTRSFMQQMMGLKTIKVFSGDKNMPVLDIIGIRYHWDIVSQIRERVEINKARKGVYEITNR